MKRLYLVRHAKPDRKNPEIADIDRPLLSAGERDALLMGTRLKEHGAAPDGIVSSPAARAVATAQIIAGEIGYTAGNITTDDTIYTGGVTDLVALIRDIDDCLGEIFMFGHNPHFTTLAELLTGHRFEHIPSCGVVRIDFGASSWKDISPRSGKLVLFDFPGKK